MAYSKVSLKVGVATELGTRYAILYLVGMTRLNVQTLSKVLPLFHPNKSNHLHC